MFAGIRPWGEWASGRQLRWSNQISGAYPPHIWGRRFLFPGRLRSALARGPGYDCLANLPVPYSSDDIREISAYLVRCSIPVPWTCRTPPLSGLCQKRRVIGRDRRARPERAHYRGHRPCWGRWKSKIQTLKEANRRNVSVIKIDATWQSRCGWNQCSSRQAENKCRQHSIGDSTGRHWTLVHIGALRRSPPNTNSRHRLGCASQSQRAAEESTIEGRAIV